MKKICIVVDIKGWAFDNIANQVKKELSKYYDIDIKYFNRHEEDIDFYLFLESLKDYDLVHFLNRRMLLLIDSDKFIESVKNDGKNINDYIKENQNKFSTAVYDYLDVDSKGIDVQKNIFNKYTKAYYVSTNELFNIYNKIDEYRKPNSIVHDVCDCSVYKPINLDRFKIDNIKNRPIVVGWCGNSLHSQNQVIDLKGYNTIIKPALEELIDEGYNIKANLLDRNIDFKKVEEMPIFYSTIDIYVCASIHEGTPRPVLECMSAGVPIISTNVGIVPESFGPLEKKFIIGRRISLENDIEIKNKLKEKIIYLYNNRELFELLSKENIKSINIFDGGKTMESFKKFFDSCLNNNE